MIRIKNVSTSLVSLFVPNIRFNRDLIPGRSIPISKEEYEELIFDSGFMALVNGHYLVIEGLEEDQQVADVGEVFPATEIARMLKEGDIQAFSRFIVKATDSEKESAVTIAVEQKITNAGIVTLIKKYCNVDVIDAIAKNHEAEIEK